MFLNYRDSFNIAFCEGCEYNVKFSTTRERLLIITSVLYLVQMNMICKIFIHMYVGMSVYSYLCYSEIQVYSYLMPLKCWRNMENMIYSK
jgi:hypothetical protein